MEPQNPGPDDLQRLVERFVKAGWIVGSAHRSAPPLSFRIEWSDKGRQKMTGLRNVLKKYAPESFEPGNMKRVGWFAEGMIVYHAIRLTADLKLPLLGPERCQVVALAVASDEDADGEVAAIYRDELP